MPESLPLRASSSRGRSGPPGDFQLVIRPLYDGSQLFQRWPFDGCLGGTTSFELDVDAGLAFPCVGKFSHEGLLGDAAACPAECDGLCLGGGSQQQVQQGRDMTLYFLILVACQA